MFDRSISANFFDHLKQDVGLGVIHSFNLIIKLKYSIISRAEAE